MSIVIGVDPGAKNTAIVVLDSKKGILYTKTCNSLKDINDTAWTMADIMYISYSKLAIESAFVSKNWESYGKTCESIGMVRAAMFEPGVYRGMNPLMIHPKTANAAIRAKAGVIGMGKWTDKQKLACARVAENTEITQLMDVHQASAYAVALAAMEIINNEENKTEEAGR